MCIEISPTITELFLWYIIIYVVPISTHSFLNGTFNQPYGWFLKHLSICISFFTLLSSCSFLTSTFKHRRAGISSNIFGITWASYIETSTKNDHFSGGYIYACWPYVLHQYGGHLQNVRWSPRGTLTVHWRVPELGKSIGREPSRYICVVAMNGSRSGSWECPSRNCQSPHQLICFSVSNMATKVSSDRADKCHPGIPWEKLTPISGTSRVYLFFPNRLAVGPVKCS